MPKLITGRFSLHIEFPLWSKKLTCFCFFFWSWFPQIWHGESQCHWYTNPSYNDHRQSLISLLLMHQPGKSIHWYDTQISKTHFECRTGPGHGCRVKVTVSVHQIHKCNDQHLLWVNKKSCRGSASVYAHTIAKSNTAVHNFSTSKSKREHWQQGLVICRSTNFCQQSRGDGDQVR